MKVFTALLCKMVKNGKQCKYSNRAMASQIRTHCLNRIIILCGNYEDYVAIRKMFILC